MEMSSKDIPTQRQQTIDKVGIMKHMIDIYSHTLIKPNLDLHREFYTMMRRLHDCKNDSDIKEYIRYINKLFSTNTQEGEYAVPRPCEFARYALPYESLQDVVVCCQREYKALEKLRGLLASNVVFDMIRFVYDSVLHRSNFKEVIAVLNWLLSQNAKNVFVRPDKSLNIVHILYGLLAHVARQKHVDMEKYVMISKDLTFYKVSKTYATSKRIDMFFTSLYIVFHECIDVKPFQKPLHDIKRKYLFVVCRIDQDQVDEVRLDRLRNHDEAVHVSLKKRLTIDDATCPQRRDNANIVKISR